MITLKEGDKAPNFKGTDQDGNSITLEQFKGNLIILYFYPEDGSEGCTAEACNLRDNYSTWTEKDFQIIGVSPDTPESHRNFIKQNALPFPLVADTDKKIINKYGVWGTTEMGGIKRERTLRTTFVISKGGFVEKVITDVNTHEHSRQLEFLLRPKPEY